MLIMGTTSHREEDGLLVTAEWDDQEIDAPPSGPRRLEIRLTENAAADVRHRGITSGVMRRAERHLADLTTEFNTVPAVGAYDVMVRQYLQTRLADFPVGPRAGGDDYYRRLLALYDDLTGRGHPAPINALAAAMNIPKETVKTRLRTARRRTPR
jgi:hypothetical protein